MKKLFLILALAAFIATTFVNYFRAQGTESFSAIELANIEALTNAETGGSIPCYSSANRNYNKAYVDCASCSRIEDWQGSGTEAVCSK